MKKFTIQDREAGNKIETFATLKEAQDRLKEFERKDKRENIFSRFLRNSRRNNLRKLGYQSGKRETERAFFNRQQRYASNGSYLRKRKHS